MSRFGEATVSAVTWAPVAGYLAAAATLLGFARRRHGLTLGDLVLRRADLALAWARLLDASTGRRRTSGPTPRSDRPHP